MSESYGTKNTREDGGDTWKIGGELDVESGGILDVKSGAAFKIAGTTVTATAAQLNAIPVTTSTAAELNMIDTSAQTETITAAGAISVTKRITNLDSTIAGFAATLDVPSAAMLGQVKIITMTVDNGDVTLALTNVQGQSAGTGATFNSVDDTLVLVAGVSKWNVIGEAGVTLA